MPRYDFKCERCGEVSERATAPSTQFIYCPKCGGQAQKQPAAPAIQFKGKGWTSKGRL